MPKRQLCNKDIWAWIFTALEAFFFFVPLIMLMFSTGEKMKKNEKDQGRT